MGWRLGRRLSRFLVAARKTHAKQVHTVFQSGETSSIPGACVPRTSGWLSVTSGSYPVGLWRHYGTASGDQASTTDEKPALASAGLTDQVE